jgi:hypothetical protein
MSVSLVVRATANRLGERRRTSCGPTYSGSWRKLYTNFPQLKSLDGKEKRHIGCVALLHSSITRACDRGMKLSAGPEIAELA